MKCSSYHSRLSFSQRSYNPLVSVMNLKSLIETISKKKFCFGERYGDLSPSSGISINFKYFHTNKFY